MKVSSCKTLNFDCPILFWIHIDVNLRLEKGR
jgi:hypothetical protein